MTNTPTRVSAGAPIRAADINAIIDAARAAREFPALAGDTAIATPSGRSGPIRRRPAPPPYWPTFGPQLPWQPRIYIDDGAWKLAINRCGYVRGPFTRILGANGTLNFDLADPPEGGPGDYWIGVKINTETGNAHPALLCSKTAADVFDTSTPPTDEYFKRLLYVFTYVAAGEETPSFWTVKSSWQRFLPELGAYV